MKLTHLLFGSFLGVACTAGCATSPSDASASATSAEEATTPAGYACAVNDRSKDAKAPVNTTVRLHSGEDVQYLALADGQHKLQLDTYVGRVQIGLVANDSDGRPIVFVQTSETGFVNLDFDSADPLPNVSVRCLPSS
jgi:hypothetical protein